MRMVGVSVFVMFSMAAVFVIPQEQDQWESMVASSGSLLSRPNQWSEELGAYLARPEVWDSSFVEFINDPQQWSTDLLDLGSWKDVEYVQPWPINNIDIWNESTSAPKTWIFGCGPIYGATERDKENLAKLCKLTGDGTSVISAHAIESDLRVRFTPEAAEVFMNHDSFFERQVAENLVREYVDRWKHISGNRVVRVHFFDRDKNVPFLEGRSTWFRGDQVTFSGD